MRLGECWIGWIIRDAYIDSSTIIASIEGSPPRAYAILYSGGVGFFSPDKDDDIIGASYYYHAAF